MRRARPLYNNLTPGPPTTGSIMFSWSTLPKGFWPSKSSQPLAGIFPDDILYMIVSWVALDSREDLKTFSLVNRQFFSITCGLIWASVEVAVDYQQSVRANNDKLNILLRRATQGVGLSALAIRLHADLPDGHHRNGFRTRLQLLTREAFQIKTLALLDTSKFMDLNGLVTADFAQHRFHLVELWCKTAPSPYLHDFLISQPTLQRLSLTPISSSRDPILTKDLPSDALPNLEAALGDLVTLQVLRDGRSVRYMAVVPYLQAELLPELWSTINIPSSRIPLEALSITIEKGDAFHDFFLHLPTHAPALRFLGLAIQSQVTGLWGIPAPQEADAAPLRSLAQLETIRWGLSPYGPRAGFQTPGNPVYFRRWRPERYAGPMLRYVQHESIFGPLEGNEGSWERRNFEGNEWGFWQKHLFPPRHESKLPLPTRDSLDPIGLEYLKPTPYVLQSRSVWAFNNS
ncbi:hypothetical protein DL93DRAFT_2226781 [Clavulina sp. PMI_390]|nr:hypothetical protein DL93DRAFT_2226781 [Clavulina sp. PMI_390]